MSLKFSERLIYILLSCFLLSSVLPWFRAAGGRSRRPYCLPSLLPPPSPFTSVMANGPNSLTIFVIISCLYGRILNCYLVSLDHVISSGRLMTNLMSLPLSQLCIIDICWKEINRVKRISVLEEKSLR